MEWIVAIFLLLSPGHTTVTISSGDYKFIKRDSSEIIEMEGFGNTLEQGKPVLPERIVNIVLPPSSRVISADIKARRVLLGDSFSILICPPHLPQVPFSEKGGISFERKGVYPAYEGRFIQTYTHRDHTIAAIVMNPFSFDSETGSLYFRPSFTINLTYIQEDTLKRENVYDYIILTKLRSAVFDDFCSWKEELGYRVKIVYPEGGPEKIREFLRDKLAKWGIKYLLIVGSPLTIPMGTVNGISTDFYYETSDENEPYPDIICGRIPYDDDEIIRKILRRNIEFEIDRGMWKKNILLVGCRGSDGSHGAYIMERVAKSINNGYKFFRVYEDMDSLPFPSDITLKEATNRKWGIIAIWAPGTEEGIMNSDGSPLISTDNLPVSPSPIFSSSALGGRGISMDCLQKSCPFVISPYDTSYYVSDFRDEEMGGTPALTYFFLEDLLNNDKSVGEAFLNARIKYWTLFPDSFTLKNIVSFTLYGDPSLLFHGIPSVDVEVKEIVSPGPWILPDSIITPEIIIKNYGRNPAYGGKAVLEINKAREILYSRTINIDTVIDERRIEFPEWRPVKGRVRVIARVIFPVDENPANDTLSTLTSIASGDYIILGDSTGLELDSILQSLGFQGIFGGMDSSLISFAYNFGVSFILSGIQDTINAVNKFIEISGNRFYRGPVYGKDMLRGMVFNYSGRIGRIPDEFQNFTPLLEDKDGNPLAFSFKGEKQEVIGFCGDFSSLKDSLSNKSLLVQRFMEIFGIEEYKESNNKKEFAILLQNQPNPFKKETAISFNLKKEAYVRLSVYTIAGNRVISLLDNELTPGFYTVFFNAKSLTSGTYFYHLQCNELSISRRMLILK